MWGPFLVPHWCLIWGTWGTNIKCASLLRHKFYKLHLFHFSTYMSVTSIRSLSLMRNISYSLLLTPVNVNPVPRKKVWCNIIAYGAITRPEVGGRCKASGLMRGALRWAVWAVPHFVPHLWHLWHTYQMCHTLWHIRVLWQGILYIFNYPRLEGVGKLDWARNGPGGRAGGCGRTGQARGGPGGRTGGCGWTAGGHGPIFKTGYK